MIEVSRKFHTYNNLFIAAILELMERQTNKNSGMMYARDILSGNVSDNTP